MMTVLISFVRVAEQNYSFYFALAGGYCCTHQGRDEIMKNVINRIMSKLGYIPFNLTKEQLWVTALESANRKKAMILDTNWLRFEIKTTRKYE